MYSASIIVVLILIALAWVNAILRITAAWPDLRHSLRKDWWIIFAFICLIALYIFAFCCYCWVLCKINTEGIQ